MMRRAEVRFHNEDPKRFQPSADPWVLRRLSDHALNTQLSDPAPTQRDPSRRVALERELRRRDAWAAPAGRAVWISAAALIVSVLALLVSFAN